MYSPLPKPPIHVLVVDDTPTNLKLLETVLSPKGYRVWPAISGPIALRALEMADELPAIILLDITMPEMDGFEVCAKLKQNPKTAKIPIIFISALGQDADKVKAFEAGGVDYVTKPFAHGEVLARIATHLSLTRQQQEIEEFNRQKDDLIRNVTLNLQSPISNIMGYAELLLAEPDMVNNVAQRERLLKGIFQSAAKIDETVNHLLEMTRMRETPKMHLSAVLVRDVLEAAVNEQLPYATQQGVAIQRLAPDEYPAGLLVWADGHWLGQVFRHLLNNAIKYTPAGGRATLQVEVTAEEVVITICDTGMGIPTSDQPHIFKPFYRSPQVEKAGIEGMGLGLPIAQNILGHHHGRLAFHSTVGQGSCFEVRLPLHRLEAGA